MNLLRRFLAARRVSPLWSTNSAGPKESSRWPISSRKSSATPRRGADAELYIEPLEAGSFIVSGNARLDDLSEHLGFEFEAEGIDTIGGFVFNRLGYLPAVRRAIGITPACHHRRGEPAGNGSKKSFSKKQLVPRMEKGTAHHDFVAGHFRVLDGFVFVRRN